MNFSKLTWGVKASFRSYVEAVEGTITASDGASRTEDGCFVFPALPGGDLSIQADGSATGAVRFGGEVTFDAHGGMLKSTLAEVGLEAGEDGIHITVLEAPMNQGRCSIAKLALIEIDAEGGITLGAEITMDGMYQIADNYPPGTELDQVRLD